MKTEKENISEFLESCGYNDVIDNIHSEHADTTFYSDIDLIAFLSYLKRLNDKTTTFSILAFKDYFETLQKHNFKVEKTKFLKKELLNYIDFIDDNIEDFRTILVELKEAKNNFQKLILYFDKINKENKETFKDIL